MPQFSEKSAARLATCRVELQTLFNEVIKTVDCMVLCGHRNEADQNEAVASGHSKDPWPTSRHNSLPSEAIDVAPCPLNWSDTQAFKTFAVMVKITASHLGIELEWGGDWQGFKDMPHWQLAKTPQVLSRGAEESSISI